MNQVATKISEEAPDSSRLVPALGESWGQAASTRVVLFWDGSQRNAYLYKSPCLPSLTAAYQVTGDGVRGVRGDKRAASHPAQPQQATSRLRPG